jgi:hypothetical protein
MQLDAGRQQPALQLCNNAVVSLTIGTIATRRSSELSIAKRNWPTGKKARGS